LTSVTPRTRCHTKRSSTEGLARDFAARSHRQASVGHRVLVRRGGARGRRGRHAVRQAVRGAVHGAERGRARRDHADGRRADRRSLSRAPPPRTGDILPPPPRGRGGARGARGGTEPPREPRFFGGETMFPPPALRRRSTERRRSRPTEPWVARPHSF